MRLKEEAEWKNILGHLPSLPHLQIDEQVGKECEMLPYNALRDARHSTPNQLTHANQQRLRDAAIDILFRTEAFASEGYRKKVRSLIESCRPENFLWLADFLVEQAKRMPIKPIKKSQADANNAAHPSNKVCSNSNSNDRMIKLEERFQAKKPVNLSPSVIDYPFTEHVEYGECALHAILMISDSHRLTRAVLENCSQNFGKRLCRRILFIFGDQQKTDVLLQNCLEPLAHWDYFQLTGHSAHYQSKGGSDLKNFLFRAMDEEIDSSSTDAMFTLRQILKLFENDKEAHKFLKEFDFLPVFKPLESSQNKAHEPNTIANQAINVGTARKLRPCPVSSTPYIVDPNFVIVERDDLQGELRKSFWWAHPELKALSQALVAAFKAIKLLNSSTSINNLGCDSGVELVGQACKHVSALLYPSLSDLQRMWTGLTLELFLEGSK